MQLPHNVLLCLQRLEEAGFPAYVVGGCVRDAVLGLQPHDFDMCTAALPEEICRIFADFPLIHNGIKHGTVGVIFPGPEVYEITTFRTEGDYADSRHPDWVAFVPEVEQDLARRDFTVNAMAYSPTRGFADPFGGRQDLHQGILRAVGEAPRRFTEDALRILRGVRFAVTYGLQVEEETMQAMISLAPRMEHLARERVFEELCKLLPKINARQLVEFAPILTQVLPELAPAIGFDQHNPHHLYDLYTHTAYVVEAVPADLTLRWAALLHDVGKIPTFVLDENGCGHFRGHAEVSATMADEILLRLKAPNDLRQQVTALIGLHMNWLLPEKKLVRRWLSRLGQQRLEQLLTLQQADMGSKGQPEPLERFDDIRALIAEILEDNACLSLRDLAVNGNDLKALGYEGAEIGAALNRLLEAVLEEKTENTRAALLAWLEETR